MRATIKDIAERVGVSKSLVSMYLNNHPLSSRIAERTKKKIDEAVREMNYQPSVTARALKNGKSKTIGLVIARISGIYSSFYTQSLMYEALKYNYQLLVSLTRFNQEEEKQCLANLISRQTDGTIYTPHLILDERIRKLLAGYPILFANVVFPEYNSCTMNSRQSLFQAFSEFKKNGYKRVTALFMVPEDQWIATAQKFCRELQLDFSPLIYFQKSIGEIYHELIMQKSDGVISISSIVPNKIISYCIQNKIREIPRFIYSYTLPNDFIDHESILGVTVNPFKQQVQMRMARIIEMIEHPETEVQHLTIPGRFLNRAELCEYYREQTADPYYQTIIEEREYFLTRKGYEQ